MTRLEPASRRTMLRALLGAAAAPVLAGHTWAQGYPVRPIRIIVPTGTGTVSDMVGRLLATHMARSMGQASNLTINVSLMAKMPYDPVKDLSPVTLVASTPNLLVVHPSLPVKTVRDLVALAKARPGSLNYASSGTGTAGHLAGEIAFE